MAGSTLHPRMRPTRPREERARLPQGRPKRSAPTWKGRFVLAPKARGQAQRVVTKFQFVRGGGRSVWSTGRYLVYMERGDHLREHFPLYDAKDQCSRAEAEAFAARTKGDPHQWHIILSPERGHEVDLTSITRRALAQLERDTGYQVDWMAANHYDTAHPHTHILLRGRDVDGQIVGLKRDYMMRGFRYRVQDIVTQDLGIRPLDKTLEPTREVQRGLEHGLDREHA